MYSPGKGFENQLPAFRGRGGLTAGRLTPFETAQRVVGERYPECYLALLAGSVVRGEATSTSDLDLVIMTDAPTAPYRESFVAHGWPVETFVHSETSLRDFFVRDAERRRPSLQTMCAEGLIARDDRALVNQVKTEAKAQLEAGSPPLKESEILELRYFLTDALDDFIGARDQTEAMFVLTDLLPQACDFIFDTRREWRGGSKWTPRRLQKVDAGLYEQLVGGLESFTKLENRDPLVAWFDSILAPYGGRHFDGFSLGKDDPA